MSVPYEVFVEAFLNKITEYDLAAIEDPGIKNDIVYGYMKRAINGFKRVCKYDLTTTGNDADECFDTDIPSDELNEIADIVSEGMVVQWLKPYVYKQELLENTLNTHDFTGYSPAELLLRVGNAYNKSQKDFTQMVREYSFDVGDLTDLHL